MKVEQLTFFRPQRWTVTELTLQIKDLLEGEPSLQDVWVQGEVSNFSRPRSGHIYFTLKDADASIRCVMWRRNAASVLFLPRDGDAVEVHGGVGVYEAGGQYQLYVDQIRPLGEGALYQEFLRLKAQLEAEGLFDESRKRSIPEFPNIIGVVTSPTGAALRDILNTLRRRYPVAEVILAPTQVQGEEAPAGIVAALQSLNRNIHPDVILLARGGGSIEDLWAFNDPRVAYAIAASEAPVISGVGHQTDFTIADFVADLRAPTPTAAAELATPHRDELRASLAEMQGRLGRNALIIVNDERWELQELVHRLEKTSPESKIRGDRQRLDEWMNRVERAMLQDIRLRRVKLVGLEQQLESLNPVAILERGYAVVSGADGEVVRSVTDVQAGDRISVRVKDGAFGAEVREGDDD